MTMQQTEIHNSHKSLVNCENDTNSELIDAPIAVFGLPGASSVEICKLKPSVRVGCPVPSNLNAKVLHVEVTGVPQKKPPEADLGMVASPAPK